MTAYGMTAYGYISPLKHLNLTVPLSPDYCLGHCPLHQLWDGQFVVAIWVMACFKHRLVRDLHLEKARTPRKSRGTTPYTPLSCRTWKTMDIQAYPWMTMVGPHCRENTMDHE